MGNMISSADNSATLKTTYDSDKVARDTAINLANGDLAVKQKLTVTGLSTFNDDITLATGKKVNGVDVAALNTNFGTLQTTVNGAVAGAVSGDFATKDINARSLTTSGAGNFGSLRTSNIDINGNITSTTGKSYITADTTTGVKVTNGLPSTDPLYAYQTISNTGDINIRVANGKQISFGSINIVNNSLNGIGVLNTTGAITSGGYLTGNGLNLNSDFSAGNLSLPALYFDTNKVLSSSEIKFGANTILNTTSLTVPTVTTTGRITSGGGITNTGTLSNTGTLTNTGAIVNTGALKLGTNKWMINEVIDATKSSGAPRLCFGSENATGATTYFACINNSGNLERF